MHGCQTRSLRRYPGYRRGRVGRTLQEPQFAQAGGLAGLDPRRARPRASFPAGGQQEPELHR